MSIAPFRIAFIGAGFIAKLQMKHLKPLENIECCDVADPVDASLKSDRGFYLIRPRDVAMSEPARLFHDWLLQEALTGSGKPGPLPLS